MSEWQAFVDKAFYALITGLFCFAVRALSKLTDSVSALNEKIAIVISTISDHDYRLRRLEKGEDHRGKK